ncbi:hypothetical protein [Desulfonatronovibrio magnus]|uniref:hypothetical protein n=1 Tax=Desulfonatronovibrio magnus TaxID=698827 RepID=UPI0005EB1804|nr:hypothetical protein [Desulfonatronovibrio magnus]
MIKRTLERKLKELAGYYPVVLITEPRQSGKTTLCRMAWPNRSYLSLESLDIMDFARNDPRGFLAQYSHDVIIDGVQEELSLIFFTTERPGVRKSISSWSREKGSQQWK